MAGEWNASADKFEVLQECRTAFLQSLYVIAQKISISTPNALEALQANAGAYFDEMILPTRRGGFEESDGLTASRISLLAESDLELEIALSDLARRLNESQLDGQRRVFLRFVTLLNRPDLATNENPVGIDGIVAGLTAMFIELGHGAEKSIAMLELTETCLNQQLPLFYGRLIEIFEQYGIKPALAKIQSASGRKTDNSAAVTSSHEQRATSPLSALQNSMLAKQASAESIAAPVSMVTMEMMQQLFTRLNSLETQGFSSGTASQGELLEPASFVTDRPMPRLPKPSELDIPLAGPEAAAIDSLALIFAAIFDNPNLPDAIKSAIGSLQITILKVAMLDSSFFTAQTHLARIFLDRMARAAIGLPLNVAHDHPVCHDIQGIASRLRAEYGSDLAVFEPHIAALETLIAKRDMEVAGAAETYISIVERHEREETATIRATEVADTLAEEGLPLPIISFIRADWSRVLRAVLIEHGEESVQWQESLKLVEDLLWTIRPMQSADDRKRLTAAIPDLLKKINAGFDRIDLSKNERDAFIDLCFTLQTNALRGIALASPPVRTSPVPAPPVTNSDHMPMEFSSSKPQEAIATLKEICSGVLLLKNLKTAADQENVEINCNIGDWLEITLPDNNLACGRYCWKTQLGDKVLLCNLDWDHAILVAPALLKQQLRSRQAQVASAASLFDEAVAKALQQT